MKQKMITIVLTILMIALPIAIMPGKTYNLPKVWILLVGGAILLVLLLINYKKITLDKKDYILLFLALIIFISTMCSSNLSISILGRKNRYEGMLALYTYFIMYYSTKKFMEYKKSKNILKILYVIYIPICILGIMQYYIKLPNSNLYPIFNRNTCGTFGNTNFMGSFISTGIPIFIICYIFNNSKMSLLTSFLCFFCLIACMARSAWVAFCCFAMAMAIYLIINKDKKYIKRGIILIAGFTTIVLILYLQKESPVKQRLNVVKNDIQITKNQGVKNELGSGRIGIWKITLELIEKYPLLGVGPDNLESGIFNNLTTTSINYMLKTKTKIDKSHNEFLQIAVTIGVPGLIAYISFLLAIIIPKLKKAFKQKETFLFLSIIGSYLAQAFFNISTIGIAPLFWIALGLADNEKNSKNLFTITEN